MPPAASFLGKKLGKNLQQKKVNARHLVLENGFDFGQCPSAIVLQVKFKTKQKSNKSNFKRFAKAKHFTFHEVKNITVRSTISLARSANITAKMPRIFAMGV